MLVGRVSRCVARRAEKRFVDAGRTLHGLGYRESSLLEVRGFLRYDQGLAAATLVLVVRDV